MHYTDGLVSSKMSMHPDGYIIRDTFYWVAPTLKSNETPRDTVMDMVFYKNILRKILKPGASYPFHSEIVLENVYICTER